MAGIFPPVMDKYELTFDFTTAAEDFKRMYDKCWEIQAQIENAKSTKDESVKAATHPYDVGAKDDKKAQVIATNLVKAFINQCDIAIGKSKNVAYWLSQLDNPLAQYLTGEMQHQRYLMAPTKPVMSASKLEELRADRKALVEFARNLESTIKLAFPNIEGIEYKDNGDVKFPNLQGAGSANTDNPTGRFAQYIGQCWTVDGKEYPPDTDIRDIFRTVFVGMDRVGKKLGDLIDPIEKLRKKAADKTALVATKINGHEVSFQIRKPDAEDNSAE